MASTTPSISRAKPCGAPHGFDVDAIAIYWGHYGRHHPGGTGRGSYKGDYVKSYQLEYLDQSDKWQTLHQHKGRPTDETSDKAKVTRFPATASVENGEVLTVLGDLKLSNVVAIRIRATGGHWIGLHELEVYGSVSEATGPKLIKLDPHAKQLDSIIENQGVTGSAAAFELAKPATSLDSVWPILQEKVTGDRKIVSMGEHRGWYWFDIAAEGHVFGYFVRKGGRDVYAWSRW